MRWLKITAGILGILLLVAILAAILLVTFVSPNRLKPLIIEKVKKHTGRELIFDGDLSWTVFPYLGVKVGHLELSNPPEFKQKIFVEIQSATIGVKILPLLTAKVESSGITFKGMKLYLIKKANGKTNWEEWQKSSSATEASTTTSSHAKKASMGLALAGVTVSNATISWVNEQTKQYFDIEKFNLNAKDINLTKPFPFEITFDITGQDPVLTGKVSLTSKMSLNLEKQNYSLHDLNLSVKIHQEAKNFDIKIKGDVAADMARQKLTLDNLVAQIANLELVGKINVTDLNTHAKTTGHLQIQPFDVKKWLQATGQDVSALQILKNMSGDFDLTAATTLESLNLQGNIKIDEAQASNVRVSNINVKTQLQHGVLDLSPLSAVFYQGNLDGRVIVNLNTVIPKIAIYAKLINIQAEPLLNDLAPNDKLKLIGIGNIDLTAATVAGSGDVMVKNFTGTSHLSFNNGILQGVDIGYLLESANALAKKQSLPSTNTNQTEFGSLTASAVIHNGVINNKDLYLNAPRFETHGKGTINLVSQEINYHLQASSKQASDAQKNNLSNMSGVSIPISIKGDLSKPGIRLETDALMKSIAQEQLQKVREKFKDKIPGNAKELINNLLGH